MPISMKDWTYRNKIFVLVLNLDNILGVWGVGIQYPEAGAKFQQNALLHLSQVFFHFINPVISILVITLEKNMYLCFMLRLTTKSYDYIRSQQRSSLSHEKE